ncbi:ABC transporter ATP-binding protein, partial [Synechococcus sp. EJ6-Ellesmere]|uniref:ABC transporter ATP-binding protein n=1 Tax=Synechococcus sp. EJ6-Ellesmere TaxID=2823734 RepID=UPI0020CEED32
MNKAALPEDIAIRASGLGKCYRIYARPKDRLLQAFWKGHRAYQEFWALRDVSFEVKRGETLGIIGRNGSGKSTLLQMICGTLTPTEGSVETNGRIAALLELGSGFNPEFTGLENVFVNASVLGLNRAETEQRLDDILAFAEIGDFIHQPVKTYSSGMQVRLAFAVASQINARCLIVDEALAVGDIVFSQKCFRFFSRFCDDGGTLLYVTHDLQSLASFSTRGLWLSHGRQKFLGDTLNCIRRFAGDCLTGSRQPDDSHTEQSAVGPSAQSSSPAIDTDQPLGILEAH